MNYKYNRMFFKLISVHDELSISNFTNSYFSQMSLGKASIVESYIKREAAIETLDIDPLVDDVRTIFNIHILSNIDKDFQKPGNHKKMMLGDDVFANTQMLTKLVMREYRNLKLTNPQATTTFNQIWKELEFRLRKSAISLSLDKMFYKGKEYDCYNEVSRFVNELDLQTKTHQIDVAITNPDLADIRKDDSALLHSLYKKVLGIYLDNLYHNSAESKDAFDAALMAGLAEIPADEIISAVFESNFDKDNLIHVNVLESILGEWKPNADDPNITNIRTALDNYLITLKQGQQMQTHAKGKKLEQIVKADAEVFRAIITKLDGDKGKETGQGCGGFGYRFGFKDTVTSVFNAAVEPNSNVAMSIKDRFSTGIAAITAATLANMAMNAGLTEVNNVFFSSSFTDILTYDILKPSVTFAAYFKIYPWARTRLEELGTLLAVKRSLVYFDKAKQGLYKEPENTPIEDHAWTIEAIAAMTGFSKQSLTELFTTGAEGEPTVLIRTQLPRWIGQKIEEIRTLNESGNYYEMIMKARGLSRDIMHEYRDVFAEKALENEIPMMGFYLDKFTDSIMLFSLLGVSVFSFYSGMLPSLLSSYAGIAAFSAVGLTEYGLIKKLVRDAHKSVGNDSKLAAAALSRFLLLCKELNRKISQLKTGIIQSDFIQTISREMPLRAYFGDFMLQLPDAVKYWGNHLKVSAKDKAALYSEYAVVSFVSFDDEKLAAFLGKNNTIQYNYNDDDKTYELVATAKITDAQLDELKTIFSSDKDKKAVDELRDKSLQIRFGASNTLWKRHFTDPDSAEMTLKRIGKDKALESIIKRDDVPDEFQSDIDFLLEKGFMKNNRQGFTKYLELVREETGKDLRGNTTPGFMKARDDGFSAKPRFVDFVMNDSAFKDYYHHNMTTEQLQDHAENLYSFLEGLERQNILNIYNNHLNLMKAAGLPFKHSEKTTWDRKIEQALLFYESAHNAKPRFSLIAQAVWFGVASTAFAPLSVAAASASLAIASTLVILNKDFFQYKNVINMIRKNIHDLDALKEDDKKKEFERTNKWAKWTSNAGLGVGVAAGAGSLGLLLPYISAPVLAVGIPVLFFAFRLDREAYANLKRDILEDYIGVATPEERKAVMKAIENDAKKDEAKKAKANKGAK